MKSEYRNPKQIRRLNAQMTQAGPMLSKVICFVLVIGCCLGFRISYFGFKWLPLSILPNGIDLVPKTLHVFGEPDHQHRFL